MKKTLICGIALATLFGAAPAIGDTTKSKAMNDEAAGQSGGMQENANREKNDDGTFQGKPVVQGPADWSSAASGASSGEAGADTEK